MASLGAIFDMDGVLVDTREAHYQAWQETFRTLGRDLERQAFLRTFGWRNLEILRELLDREIGQERAEQLGSEKERRYREVIAGRLEPMPGLLPLLDDLERGGFGLAVGTSAPRENLEAVLGQLGLGGRFQARVVGGEVERGKPDPDTFLLASQRLGVPPERCAVFEDAPAGVKAANRAGMVCVALTGTADAAALAEADLVVDGLAAVDAGTVRALMGL